MKIMIVVDGGCLVSVQADKEGIDEVILLDRDNERERLGRDELDELEAKLGREYPFNLQVDTPWCANVV